MLRINIRTCFECPCSKFGDNYVFCMKWGYYHEKIRTVGKVKEIQDIALGGKSYIPEWCPLDNIEVVKNG